MSSSMNPGQTAEIAGPKKAFLITKPSVAVSMIKRADRPLLIVGSHSTKIKTKDGDLIDTVSRLCRDLDITVAVTGHLIGLFKERGVNQAYSMPLMSLGDRLRSENWEGFDGKGPYDIILFVGHQYYLAWLVLSGLKNFASDLTTISISASYQPNASWSLGSMSHEKWMEQLDEIVKQMEAEK